MKGESLKNIDRSRYLRDGPAPGPPGPSPKPKCKLVGTDGNVFALAGQVKKALKRAGMSERATEFAERLKDSGSYDGALQLMMEYVDVE